MTGKMYIDCPLQPSYPHSEWHTLHDGNFTTITSSKELCQRENVIPKFTNKVFLKSAPQYLSANMMQVKGSSQKSIIKGAAETEKQYVFTMTLFLLLMVYSWRKD